MSVSSKMTACMNEFYAAGNDSRANGILHKLYEEQDQKRFITKENRHTLGENVAPYSEKVKYCSFYSSDHDKRDETQIVECYEEKEPSTCSTVLAGDSCNITRSSVLFTGEKRQYSPYQSRVELLQGKELKRTEEEDSWERELRTPMLKVKLNFKSATSESDCSTHSPPDYPQSAERENFLPYASRKFLSSKPSQHFDANCDTFETPKGDSTLRNAPMRETTAQRRPVSATRGHLKTDLTTSRGSVSVFDCLYSNVSPSHRDLIVRKPSMLATEVDEERKYVLDKHLNKLLRMYADFSGTDDVEELIQEILETSEGQKLFETLIETVLSAEELERIEKRSTTTGNDGMHGKWAANVEPRFLNFGDASESEPRISSTCERASSRKARKEFEAFLERQREYQEKKMQKLIQAAKDSTPSFQPLINCKTKQAGEISKPLKVDTEEQSHSEDEDIEFMGSVSSSFNFQASRGQCKKIPNDIAHTPTTSFSFHPQITSLAQKIGNRKNLCEMLHREHERREKAQWAAQQAAVQHELKQLTFTPKLNSNRSRSSHIGSTTVNYSKYEVFRKRKEDRLKSLREKLALEKEREELKECTFRPRITKPPAYLRQVASDFRSIRQSLS